APGRKCLRIEAKRIKQDCVSVLGVILPGFDPNTPQNVWDGLLRRVEEDHPQYRYAVLLDALGLDPQTLPPWSATAAPNAQRNRIISLALRPAPVTDQWLQDGPSLGPLADGLTDVTLIEARDGREEANAIALRLRQAAEAGETAALISPDRTLTRRVSAALDRWHIVPDDAAGIPLSLTAPGRLLRQLAALGRHGIASDTLIALLKHPLVSSGDGRGPHLLFTRALELHLRRRGPPFPKLSDIESWTEQDDTRGAWGAWLGRAMDMPAWANLPEFLTWLRETAELLAAGPGTAGSGALWDEAPGRAASGLMDELADVASDDDDLGTVDPLTLLSTAMGAIPMNIQNVTHPGIMIWGTLDARAQGASLVILGGLNEGSWPQQTAPDPWLNRDMRRTAGLRSPERQVGLSAHDFQQAVRAGEVWLTRATKSDDAETVPSRWLNRITTMLQGLPDQDGPAALEAMRARGAAWLSDAARLDLAARVDPAPRPAPIPPVSVRPKKLSVTEIKTLIRDPYAIYARHILRLRELDPLVGEPDALLRGTVLHKVMEDVVRVGLPDDLDDGLALIRQTAARVLERDVSWRAARAMWQARVMRAAPWFISTERTRAAGVTQTALETKGALTLPSRDFTLTGEADRIDLTSDGRARIFDYKTGTPPSDKQQRAFDKQLLLEALMAERGAFDALGPVPVERAAYIGLGSTPSERDAPLGETEVWAEFETLIARMQSPDHGFTARRAMEREADKSPYDLLSRHGEWSSADAAMKIRL
ncbi:MAG: double-strand break repair protein AddB, partial [Pseudomonadota bacterium]